MIKKIAIGVGVLLAIIVALGLWGKAKTGADVTDQTISAYINENPKASFKTEHSALRLTVTGNQMTKTGVFSILNAVGTFPGGIAVVVMCPTGATGRSSLALGETATVSGSPFLASVSDDGKEFRLSPLGKCEIK